jgi:hypothetical protein
MNRRMKVRLVFAIGFSVLVVFVAIELVVYFSAATWADRGTIGDSFGAVNALFSGLALAGVVCAILLQREELQLQREEIKATRVEHAKSSQAQSETAASQSRLAELNAYTALLSLNMERHRLARAKLATAGVNDLDARNNERWLSSLNATFEQEINRILDEIKGEGYSESLRI